MLSEGLKGALPGDQLQPPEELGSTCPHLVGVRAQPLWMNPHREGGVREAAFWVHVVVGGGE